MTILSTGLRYGELRATQSLRRRFAHMNVRRKAGLDSISGSGGDCAWGSGIWRNLIGGAVDCGILSIVFGTSW